MLVIAQEDGLWAELTDSIENDHLGFDYKWSGGWTKDLLSYLQTDPVMRKGCHDQLTLSMLYAYCEYYILTLGRRDIQSITKWQNSFPVPDEQKPAQLRAALTYQILHPGCKMLEADPDPAPSLRTFIRERNELYRSHPALYVSDHDSEGFEWIQLTQYEKNVVAFLRRSTQPEETLLAVVYFSAVPYEKYEVGVPFHGKYKEIFNSDQVRYGGSGFVNSRVKTNRPLECDEREESVVIRLGALTAAVFSCSEI